MLPSLSPSAMGHCTSGGGVLSVRVWGGGASCPCYTGITEGGGSLCCVAPELFIAPVHAVTHPGSILQGWDSCLKANTCHTSTTTHFTTATKSHRLPSPYTRGHIYYTYCAGGGGSNMGQYHVQYTVYFQRLGYCQALCNAWVHLFTQG